MDGGQWARVGSQSEHNDDDDHDDRDNVEIVAGPHKHRHSGQCVAARATLVDGRGGRCERKTMRDQAGQSSPRRARARERGLARPREKEKSDDTNQ